MQERKNPLSFTLQQVAEIISTTRGDRHRSTVRDKQLCCHWNGNMIPFVVLYHGTYQAFSPDLPFSHTDQSFPLLLKKRQEGKKIRFLPFRDRRWMKTVPRGKGTNWAVWTQSCSAQLSASEELLHSSKLEDSPQNLNKTPTRSGMCFSKSRWHLPGHVPVPAVPAESLSLQLFCFIFLAALKLVFDSAFPKVV